LHKDALRCLNEEDLAQAESLYRAELVQYLSWVHAHTLPFADAHIPVIRDIVEVDLAALTELADSVAHCLYWMGKAGDIPGFLDHLESVVPLNGFEKDAAYLRALWLHVGFRDRRGAVRELAKLGDILAYPRRQAWELYLDVAGPDLTERQKIAIAEHIVAEADEDEHVRVQYAALKAIALIQIGETDAARKEFEALLQSVKAPARIQTVEELSTEWQIGKAWSVYGELFSDANALDKAEASLLRIPETMLKPAGKAALQRDLGWVLRGQGRYGDAAAAFRCSLAHDNTEIGQIHLIHSLALSGQTEEARTVLATLTPEKIDPNLRLEYSAAQGSLAIACDDTHLGTQTVEGLRTLAMPTPFWEAQRNQLLIQMLDFVHRPQAKSKAERQGMILKILVFMNDVLELKPNFFGLGVNLNKLIEKLVQRAREEGHSASSTHLDSLNLHQGVRSPSRR
jgi:tetratricopeptide (TPR) repeat protein